MSIPSSAQNKLWEKPVLSWTCSTLPCTFTGLWEARRLSPPSHGYLSSPSCVRSCLEKDLACSPSRILSRWVSIWSGCWKLVCARPLLWDVEVTMRRELSERKSLNCKLWKWDYCRDPDSPPCFCWLQLFATWPHNIIASYKMTFPLLLWRGRASFSNIPSLCCSTLWRPSPCFCPWPRWKRCSWIFR